MTTGKQSAVHAQQNSDGTFELHVDSGEEHYAVDEPILALEPATKSRNWKVPVVLGMAVLLVVMFAGVFLWSQQSETGQIAENLEPVQGFRPYTGGAGAPTVAKRPSRAAVVPDDTEEEFEDETGGEIEPEPTREEAVVPMRPPAVLENRVIEEVEESPEESGWDVEEGEGVEEVEPDEQGNLMNNIKKRGRLEQIDRNAHLNSAQLPVGVIARSKRHLAIGSDVRRAGDRARFARVAAAKEMKADSENE